MFLHWSAIPAGVTGNGAVRSLGNNVSSIYGAVGNGGRQGDSQHQGGRGPAVRGKVNSGEVWLKAVSSGERKMLSGLNQEVCGQAPGLEFRSRNELCKANEDWR